jgi:hypothetical protein
MANTACESFACVSVNLLRHAVSHPRGLSPIRPSSSIDPNRIPSKTMSSTTLDVDTLPDFFYDDVSAEEGMQMEFDVDVQRDPFSCHEDDGVGESHRAASAPLSASPVTMDEDVHVELGLHCSSSQEVAGNYSFGEPEFDSLGKRGCPSRPPVSSSHCPSLQHSVLVALRVVVLQLTHSVPPPPLWQVNETGQCPHSEDSLWTQMDIADAEAASIAEAAAVAEAAATEAAAITEAVGPSPESLSRMARRAADWYVVSPRPLLVRPPLSSTGFPAPSKRDDLTQPSLWPL